MKKGIRVITALAIVTALAGLLVVWQRHAPWLSGRGEAEGPGAASGATRAGVITINAEIRGKASLHLRGNTARWQQFARSAPELAKSRNRPTVINNVEWRPIWPDLLAGDAAGTIAEWYGDFSEVFAGVSPPLPARPMTMKLNILYNWGATTLIQQPAKSNAYTLIVEFDDQGQPAPPDTFQVEIHYQVTPADAAGAAAPKDETDQLIDDIEAELTTTGIDEPDPALPSRDMSVGPPPTSLKQAVRSRDLEVVKQLLADGGKPNQPGQGGRRPLHWSAAYGDVGIAAALLAAGADPNVVDNAGAAPLHWAAMFGRTAVVRQLLAAGAKVNARNHAEQSPLHLAAWSGALEVITALLDSQADHQAVDADGRQPQEWLRALQPSFFDDPAKAAGNPILALWMLEDRVRVVSVVQDPRDASLRLNMHVINPFDALLEGRVQWRKPTDSRWLCQPDEMQLAIDPLVTELLTLKVKYRPDGRLLPLPVLEVSLRQGDGKATAKRIKLPVNPIDYIVREKRFLACQPADASPTLDGDLADPAWQRTPDIKSYIPTDLKWPPEAETHTWATYDAEHLFLAFRCLEPTVDKIVAPRRRRDGELFMDDNLEVFIDANKDRKTYFQFAANAAGSQYDGQQQTPEWDGVWRVVVDREDKAWTAEFAIPWSTLECDPPEDGQLMGIQFVRTRAAGGRRDLMQWALTGGGNHTPQSFGLIQFKKP